MFRRCGVDFEQLVDLVLGQLDEERAAWLQDHVQKGCAHCRREINWLRRVLSAMQADDLVEPPAWVLRRAISLFAQRYPPRAPTIPLFRRIAAQLVFDSRLAGAPLGVRAEATLARQLLYQADDLDIDLHIEPTEREGEYTIIGQILSSSRDLAQVAGADVQLLNGYRKVLSKCTDDLGEFVFGRLPAGRYSLRVRLGSREIELTDIEL